MPSHQIHVIEGRRSHALLHRVADVEMQNQPVTLTDLPRPHVPGFVPAVVGHDVRDGVAVAGDLHRVAVPVVRCSLGVQAHPTRLDVEDLHVAGFEHRAIGELQRAPQPGNTIQPTSETPPVIDDGLFDGQDVQVGGAEQPPVRLQRRVDCRRCQPLLLGMGQRRDRRLLVPIEVLRELVRQRPPLGRQMRTRRPLRLTDETIELLGLLLVVDIEAVPLARLISAAPYNTRRSFHRCRLNVFSTCLPKLLGRPYMTRAGFALLRHLRRMVDVRSRVVRMSLEVDHHCAPARGQPETNSSSRRSRSSIRPASSRSVNTCTANAS